MKIAKDVPLTYCCDSRRHDEITGSKASSQKNNMSKKVITEVKSTKARVTNAAMEFVEAAVLSYEAGGAAGTMRGVGTGRLYHSLDYEAFTNY